jgi:hypothetical protein
MMREANTPFLFCYTTKDPLVFEKDYLKYAEMLGVSSFDSYDRELNLLEKGNFGYQLPFRNSGQQSNGYTFNPFSTVLSF